MAKKKATHLVKKKGKIVKNTEVMKQVVEKSISVGNTEYKYFCRACGNGIEKVVAMSCGQGEYLCKPCYSKGK